MLEHYSWVKDRVALVIYDQATRYLGAYPRPKRDLDNTILGIVEGTQSNWRCHDDCSKFCYDDGYVSSAYIKKFSEHEMELFLIDKVSDDQNWVENKNSKGEFVKKDKDVLSTEYVTN